MSLSIPLSSCVLPPRVQGREMFHFKLGVSSIHIQSATSPSNYLVRVQFWGWDTKQVLNNTCGSLRGRDAFSFLFPVHCEAVDFFHYLLDGHYLYFEVCDMNRLEPIGFFILDTTKDVDPPNEKGVNPLCQRQGGNTIWDDECYVDVYDYHDGTVTGQAHIRMSLLSVH